MTAIEKHDHLKMGVEQRLQAILFQTLDGCTKRAQQMPPHPLVPFYLAARHRLHVFKYAVDHGDDLQ